LNKTLAVEVVTSHPLPTFNRRLKTAVLFARTFPTVPDASEILFITVRAKLSGTMYGNRSCLFVCLLVCGLVCGSVTTITRNCVHRSSPNWVCRWR